MNFEEAVLYRDDSLFIRYTDGSVLQLSPCSSVFRFYQESSFNKPIQQFSRFAVSSYRKQVISAISLRNQYACYPYLCKDLINKDSIIVSYKEIKQCTWPRTVLPDFVVSNSDGNILVKSLDGYASLVLSSHKNTFTVCYLAEVKPSSEQPEADQQLKKKQLFFTWLQKGEQSVDDCQECWLYPLRLALLVGDGVRTTAEEMSKMTNVTELPVSLPITCPASYAHKWIPKQDFSGKENEDVFWQPNLKAVWKNEVLYRVYKRRKEVLKINIYPGDESVIFSSNLSGRFFTHSTGISEDKMYSADQPPPDKPGMKYSIARLIRQGARLFEFMLQVSLHGNSQNTPSCWETKVMDVPDVLSETTPFQISETATIPNVGRFVAYSNGHLHIAFADRTILNVRYSPNNNPQILKQKAILESGLVFNVILPNGQAIQVSSQNMCGLERYIKLACEWGDWVNSSPQQRQSFYKDTLYDQHQQRNVDLEISKLRRFNCSYFLFPFFYQVLLLGGKHVRLTITPWTDILNNGSLNQMLMSPIHNYPESSSKEDQDPQGKEKPSIDHALRKTTEAIKDIESFLHSNTVKKNI